MILLILWKGNMTMCCPPNLWTVVTSSKQLQNP